MASWQATGVSIATIRVYEREGLIGEAQRTTGRFRLFGPEHAVRLLFIKQLRDLGFAMDDMRGIIAAQSDGERIDVMSAVVSKARSRAEALDKLITYLNSIQAGDAHLASIEEVFESDR